jgi:prevent-host-death family protein
MYHLAMEKIPATAARQRWAQTLDAARRAPVTITEHGRETVVVMDVELSRRALAALEDAQDAQAASEAARAIADGEETVPLADLARELGFTLG